MRFTIPPVAVLVAASLAGCGGGSTMSVSTALKSSAAAAVAAPAAPSPVTLSKLYLVVKELELEKGSAPATAPAAAATGSTTGGSSAPSTKELQDLEIGPFVVVVDLAATGLQVAIPDVTIPEGSYKGVEFEIHRVRAGEKLNVPTTAGGVDLVGVSMVLEGTCAGTAGPTGFSVTSAMEVEVEYEAAIVVGKDTKNNVTFQFDTTKWLTGPSGALDPCVKNDAVYAQIAANVKASLRAFDDDDRNGLDD
jgi:hypothetical protein